MCITRRFEKGLFFPAPKYDVSDGLESSPWSGSESDCCIVQEQAVEQILRFSNIVILWHLENPIQAT